LLGIKKQACQGHIMAGLPPPNQPIFNYPNNKLYQYEAYPVLLSCNFIVDPTNGNGLGQRSLKGSGIANVFMHTSATPGIGNYGQLNPNPASGIIVVQLTNNFNRYLSGWAGEVSPLSGTPLTAVVAGNPYVIVSLGTATLAQWQAVGFPVGMVPAVGAAFVATSSATIGGSASVEAPSQSGIDHIEVVGDPNQTMQNSNLYLNCGGQIVMQCLLSTTLTAPAAGTVVGLNLYMSNSSVSVSGQ
jgi:hypothetical protein